LVFEPRTGVWSWLIDSYDDGTAFITDDPHGSQAPIVDGLRRNVARAIVNAHNAALAHERSAGAVAPIDVEVLAQAMWGTSEADMHQGKAIAWAKRVAAEYARLLDAASPSAETGADE